MWDKVLKTLPVHSSVHPLGPRVLHVGQGWALKLHTHCSTATQTIRIWTRMQGTQMHGVATIAPTYQPGRVYRPKDLGFGSMDLWHMCLLTMPMMQLLILLPVGLSAMGDLMVAIPLYCVLIGELMLGIPLSFEMLNRYHAKA